MSVSIKLGTDLIWGTSSTSPGTGVSTLGKVISCNSESAAKAFEQEDENNELYSLILHDQRENLDIEVLAGATATKPAVGAALTVAGQTAAICLSSTEKWAAGSTKKFSIKAMKSNK